MVSIIATSGSSSSTVRPASFLSWLNSALGNVSSDAASIPSLTDNDDSVVLLLKNSKPENSLERFITLNSASFRQMQYKNCRTHLTGFLVHKGEEQIREHRRKLT